MSNETPAAQRRYRHERKVLQATVMSELCDGGPVTLPKGQGQTNKLNGLLRHLTSAGMEVEVTESINEYTLIAI